MQKAFFFILAFSFFFVFVAAPIEIQVMGFDVSGNDITTNLVVNRGIDSAARDRGAPFSVTGTLTYPELASPIAFDVPLKQTNLVEKLDNSTVHVSFTIRVDRPPASAEDVNGFARIVFGSEPTIIK